MLVFVICFAIIGAAAREVKKQKQKTNCLDQTVRLISFVSNDLHYRKSDCDSLYEAALLQGFSCIKAMNGELLPEGCYDDNVRSDFAVFLKSIGTTDTDGQLKLCEEYYQRMSDYLEAQRAVEKNKTQVDFAVSLLGAFCVVVLFV